MMNQDFRAPQGCVRGTAGAGREAPAEGEGAGRDARYGISRRRLPFDLPELPRRVKHQGGASQGAVSV
jgi:hypothetical protein